MQVLSQIRDVAHARREAIGDDLVAIVPRGHLKALRTQQQRDHRGRGVGDAWDREGEPVLGLHRGISIAALAADPCREQIELPMKSATKALAGSS